MHSTNLVRIALAAMFVSIAAYAGCAAYNSLLDARERTEQRLQQYEQREARAIDA